MYVCMHVYMYVCVHTQASGYGSFGLAPNLH